MMTKASKTCCPCFVKRAPALIVGVAALGLALLTAASAASACGWGPPAVEDTTTFDPSSILPDIPSGVFYDPYSSDYGGLSREDAKKTMLADWTSRLGPDIRIQDWTQILFYTDRDTLATISAYVAGTGKTVPKQFARNSVVTAPATLRSTLIAALEVVSFARRVEPFSAYHSEWQVPPPIDKEEASALLAEENVNLEHEVDSFFAQRRAFLLMRLLFYCKKFKTLIQFAAEHEAALRAPSNSLWYRAQYYKAGALIRTNKRAMANLLLARIHFAYPPLAGETLRDFKPQDRDDWLQALTLSKTTAEKIGLWRMVGIKYDPIAAVDEIQALKPADESLAVLALRALAKGEIDNSDLAAVEQTVLSAASSAGDNSNWKFYMIAAHISALKKNLSQTRQRLTMARRTAPKEIAVERQMSATEALPLAHRLRVGNAVDERAFMKLVAAINDPDYNRADAVRNRVLAAAAETYKRAGRNVEAALIYPWSTVIGPSMNGSHAHNNTFMARLLRRVQQSQTPFDRFIVKLSGFSVEQLKTHMAWLHLKQGEIAAARRMIGESGLDDAYLGYDLFSARIIDCVDCKAVNSDAKSWTAGDFAKELVRLEAEARGRNESAAKAAMLLGNGLYNAFIRHKDWDETRGIYHYLPGPNPALRWYRRAYQVTQNRERKAEAAFLAAKCEVNRSLAELPPQRNPYAESPTWWGALKKLSDTTYQKQVLKECGWYRKWAEQ